MYLHWKLQAESQLLGVRVYSHRRKRIRSDLSEKKTQLIGSALWPCGRRKTTKKNPPNETKHKRPFDSILERFDKFMQMSRVSTD